MIGDIGRHGPIAAEMSSFRAVVEASTDAIVILSPDGQPLFVNSAYQSLFGRTPDDILRQGLGRTLPEPSGRVVPRGIGCPEPGR